MEKYIARGFDYEKAWRSTEELVAKVETILRELPKLIKGEKTLNSKGRSWDDLYVLPSLRVLSCVKPLRWPTEVRDYLERNCADGKVRCYFQDAC